VIRNILWDIDGVLFDTYPAITFAISKTLIGLDRSIALNVIDELVRQSCDHCIDMLSQRFKLDPDLLRDEFAASYQEILPANQPPFPGVRTACQFIRQSGGRNLIATHRDRQSTQRLLVAHGLIHYFDEIFSVEQGYPRKPDPAMVLAALKKYALNPEETLLIGDRESDVRAGQAAGARTCLYGRAALSQPADYRIDDYLQLLNFIKGKE
jgi:HAD superfamily hydrolase (TIGR01509 family)